MFGVRYVPKIRLNCLGIQKFMSTTTNIDPTGADPERTHTGGYAKAYEKFEKLKEPVTESYNFSSLLRNSKFIDLGDPEGKVVVGKIFHIVGDDLYIDFGWKFHCVCPVPKKQSSSYIRGARVRLLIKDLELSSKFLGYDKDLTLLESDCVLLGLMQDKTSGNKT